MTIATTSSTAGRSPLHDLPWLAAALAIIAVALLGLAPLGWRAGWWHFRFSLLTLLPWAAYLGIATVVVAALALLLGRPRIFAVALAAIAAVIVVFAPIGWLAGMWDFRVTVVADLSSACALILSALILYFSRSRMEWGRVAIAVIAFIVGGLVAYVPWHYDTVRRTVPAINDITTDIDDPPAFIAAVVARTAEEGTNPVAYPGAKFAEQQKQAYPDIAPLVLALPPDRAFSRALDAAQSMGWKIVTADPIAGRIEASDRSRWMGFVDDIAIRITPSGSGSRIDMRSSSRLGRSDFGVNAGRIHAYLATLRAAANGQG
jgi:uncharacterized protein (DUF1499 family)